MTPSIREATLEDLDLLVRHRRNMWEEISEFPEDELDLQDRTYRRWARERLASGRLIGFIIETGRGHIAASACLWLSPSQPRPGWRGSAVPYLMSMFTEREDRGKGHATRLVRKAVEWSRSHGYNMIVLHASGAGRRVYEREGFTPTTEMRRPLNHSPRRRRRMGPSRSRRRSLNRG